MTAKNCATTEDRISDLEKKIEQFSSRLSALSQTSTRSASAVARHEKLLKLIDQHKAVRTLDDIQARIAELSAKLQVELLKIEVCSEVPRVYPDVWPHLMQALDMDNDWWRCRRELTISEWRQSLMSRALQ